MCACRTDSGKTNVDGTKAENPSESPIPRWELESEMQEAAIRDDLIAKKLERADQLPEPEKHAEFKSKPPDV